MYKQNKLDANEIHFAKELNLSWLVTVYSLLSFSPAKKLYLKYYVKGKGKVTPKQAYVALRGPGG
jgi:hypothetical protein